MWRFVALRTLGGLATIVITSFVVYGALYLAPGSPANFLVKGLSVTPERIAQIEEQYHLNDPFLTQWWNWFSSAVTGDFGQSLIFRDDVWSLIQPRIGTTALLIAYASFLTVAFGVISGTAAALRGGRTDGLVTVITSFGLAIPNFVAAVILIALFGVELGWFPTFGNGGGIFDQIYHLTLPAIALALAGGAYVSRITRAAVKQEATSEHVLTARSRGLPEQLVVRRHILRNAMVPVTTVAGLTIAGLIAGTVIVETAFGLNGIGALLIQSVEQKDFAVVQAITLLMVAAFVVVNTIVDVVYGLMDPRIGERIRST